MLLCGRTALLASISVQAHISSETFVPHIIHCKNTIKLSFEPPYLLAPVHFHSLNSPGVSLPITRERRPLFFCVSFCSDVFVILTQSLAFAAQRETLLSAQEVYIAFLAVWRRGRHPNRPLPPQETTTVE